MSRPPFTVLAVCLLMSTPCIARADDAPSESASVKPIFDGQSLAGWSGDERLWSVKDGVIRGETTAENPASGNTFLIWQGGDVSDFELRLSFRLSVTNNSGIQYRSKHITEGKKLRNQWVVRGYQHELRNEEKLPNVSGFIYDEGGRRGRIILVGQKGEWQGEKLVADQQPLISADEFEKLMKVDDWNDVIIIARGRRVQHYLNGRLVMDFTDSEENALTSGVLALQLHAGKPMWTEFKNVRLGDLSQKK
ncbi:MAG: DUF1080 domain-containing protein [Fuerstiella sp.]